MSFDIVRTAHVEFRVKDLERSRDFYVKTLGFVETESTKNRIYLRGLEDRCHHSLLLTEDDEPAVDHISYRARNEFDLEAIAELFEKLGLRFRWIKAESDERGQGRALRAQDPLGFPVEFFCEMREVEWMWQKFDKHQGARIMRIDHVNMLVPDVQKASDW